MYTDKYHREHKTIREHLGVLALAVKKVPEGELTPFANCSGGDSETFVRITRIYFIENGMRWFNQDNLEPRPVRKVAKPL